MSILLLWDIDGTLLRNKGVGSRAMTRAFHEVYGVENAFAGLGFAGGLDLHFFDAAFQKAGLPRPEHIDDFLETYYRTLRDELRSGDLTLLPGVVEILERAQQEPDLYNALGTGNVETGARIKLEPFDLNRFFPVGGFCVAAVERWEMLRDGVENARRHYGVDFVPEQVVVIGDTVKDIAAARKIGARVVAVCTGGSSRDDLAALEPDLLLPSLAEPNDFWTWLNTCR